MSQGIDKEIVGVVVVWVGKGGNIEILGEGGVVSRRDRDRGGRVRGYGKSGGVR